MIFISALLLFSSFASANSECVPAREEISVPHSGHYHRIHPSGNYFMYTEGSESVIYNITDRAHPKKIKTPMREEAYPVEAADGGWELIASPLEGGSQGPRGGSEYFRFADLIKDSSSPAKAVYTDDQHGEWYLSSATLPGSTAASKKVRTLLFSDRDYRDYQMSTDRSGKVTASKGPRKNICSNFFQPRDPESPANTEFLKEMDEIDTLVEKLMGLASNPNSAAYKALRNKIEAKREKAEEKRYGREFAQKAKKSRELEEEYDKTVEALQNSPEAKLRDKQSEEHSTKLRALNQKVSEDKRLVEARQQVTQLEEQLRATVTAEDRSKAQAGLSKARKDVSELLTKLHQEYGSEQIWNDYQKNQNAFDLFMNTSPIGVKLRDIGSKRDELSSQLDAMREGLMLNNPILSKDGQFVAGLVYDKIVVYKVAANGSCTVAAKIDYRGSKVSFSYPEPGKAPKVTFTVEDGATGSYGRGAYIYDLGTKKAQLISKSDDEAYYPGFTKDGRVMYKSGDKMIIVDPNQVDGNASHCIKVAASTTAGSSKNSSSKTTSKHGER